MHASWNCSKLPNNSFKRTNNRLSTISFTKDDIAKIIKNFNPNKADDFDMMSIRMINICGESILKPLEFIFKLSLENGKFPIEWKKANVVPAHERNNRQLIQNCCPISLLPVCGKILEQVIYNKIFEFFYKKWTNLSESIRVQTRILMHQSNIVYHSRYLSITWWRPWGMSRLPWYTKGIW